MSITIYGMKQIRVLCWYSWKNLEKVRCVYVNRYPYEFGCLKIQFRFNKY